jgi:hypothetical protein
VEELSFSSTRDFNIICYLFRESRRKDLDQLASQRFKRNQTALEANGQQHLF